MRRIINFLTTFIKIRKKLTAIILVLLLVLGFFIWWIFQKNNQQPTFTTAQVEKGTIVSTISASGNLIQTNTFTVTTQATGIVKNVFVKDGQKVKKGDKLVEVTLDESGEEARTKAWASYLSAKNALESASQNKLSLQKEVASAKDTLIGIEQSKLELLQKLYKAESDLITAKNDFSAVEALPVENTDRQKKELALKSAQAAYDLAKQKYDSADASIETAKLGVTTAEQKYKGGDSPINKAKADLNAAQIAYKLTSPIITAPQGGKVSGIAVVARMVISSSSSTSSSSSEEQVKGEQKILSIVNESLPLVSVSVNEIDIQRIAVNQKATLIFDALPEKTFTGEVVGVDRTGTETQDVVSYQVLIQLDTAEDALYPNMTATAEIIIESKDNVLWVPPQAVKEQAGQTTVSVLVNGKPEGRQVQVGLETASQAEIISGLSKGETVVVSEQTPGGETPAFGGQGGFRGIMTMPGGPGREGR